MRFGLVGTGPWAHLTQGPGLIAAEGVELAGVWGRDAGKVATLADELGVSAYSTMADLIDDVEAVAFCVPPQIQAELAVEAAGKGRHLLLDKPAALSVDAARSLAEASADVASLIFFTDRFVDTSRNWFEEVHATGGWQGGWVRWFSALQDPGNPFGASPWRHEHGALWDIGPHALSTLTASLGPVTSLIAEGGERDLVTLVLHHESGATSQVILTAFAPPAATHFTCELWGEAGVVTMPPRPTGSIAPMFATAAEELVTAAQSGKPHDLDLRFGVRVVELLAEAEAQLRDRARVVAGPRSP